MRRRALLGFAVGAGMSGVLGSYGCAARGTAAAQQPVDGFSQFGLQLSTITPLMREDFEGALALAAEVGYRQVEFSAQGFLGRSAHEVRGLLDKYNLSAPVGRISPKLPPHIARMSPAEARQMFIALSHRDRLLETAKYSLDDALTLEQKYLNLPALMPNFFASLDEVQRSIEVINQVGELCAQQGVLFGYHNHDWELRPVEGQVPLQMMLQATAQDRVAFQLDTYWVVKGGGNLHEYLDTYPGRFVSCHLKDIDEFGVFADVGYGEINFPKFITHALQTGTRYFFVERDNPPQPESAIRRSYGYLEGLVA